MAAMIRMQENHGWRCTRDYKSDSRFVAPVPEFLAPSRNDRLKGIPSLQQGLVSVDRAALLGMAGGGKMGSMIAMDDEGSAVFPFDKVFGWKCSSLSGESCAEGCGELCCAQEVPSLKQNWGYDLELAAPASPLVKLHSPSSAAGIPKSSSRPFSCLDLNLDLSEPQEQALGSTPTTAEPSVKNVEFLNLELGTSPSSLSSHFPTEESGVVPAKCLPLDSPTSYSNSNSNSSSSSNIFFSTCTDDETKQPITTTTPSAATSEGSIGNNHNHGGKIMSLSLATEADPIMSKNSAPTKHMAAVEKSVNYASPASSTDHSNYWKEESSITQSWQPCLAAGEIRSHERVHSTSERITELTLHVLSQYFHMPINQASKELKVGLTVLKKRCREFGIPRWPHRKMKSLESLINNIQDLAKDQGVKSSVRVMNTVKELEEQKKLMEEMPGTELAERTKRLRQACFKANYKKRRLMVATSSGGGGTSTTNASSSKCRFPLSLDLNRSLISSRNQFGFL